MNGKPSKDLIQEVNATIEESLLAMGCKKRRKEWYTFEVTAGFLGTVAISRSVERGNGVLYINPMIGIRSDQFQNLYEELRAELIDKKNKDYPYFPTLIWQFDDVSKVDPECQFFHDTLINKENIKSRCRMITDAVMKDCIPFIKNYASLEKICKSLITGRVSTLRRETYLPIALFFEKRYSEARSVLKKAVKKELDDFHGSQTYMKKFSEKLFKKISEFERN